MHRWTKYANKGIEFSDAKYGSNTQTDTRKILRRVHTQQEANALVDLAEESNEIYKFIISEFSNIHV